MAMGTRGGGRGNANRPPRLIVNRVYEQFKPMSEWRQEDGHDTLLVYLPGFQKEYIKVTTENSNVVRVRGERLVAQNKWSRFQEDYRVPENCEMRGIRARFEGGILTITIPRKINNNAPPSSQPTTTTTKAPGAPKTLARPLKPKEEPKEKKQDKPQTGSLPPQPKPASSSTPTKPDKPQTSRLEDNTLPPPQRPTPSAKPEKPQTSRLQDNTLPPQPKPTFSSIPAKQKKPQTSSLEDHTLPPQQKPTSSSTLDEPNKPQTTRLEDNTLPPQPKPASSSVPTKPPPSKLALEAKEDVEFATESLPRDKFEHVIEKPGVGEKTELPEEKGKETMPKEETERDVLGSKGNPNNSGLIGGGLRNIIVRRGVVNEDRKLLVNVGVGILIIAALGVHVSYTMGLIGKGE